MTTYTVATETSEDDFLYLRDWSYALIPGGYSPYPYRLGPICEHCWLNWGRIQTLGQFNCPH